MSALHYGDDSFEHAIVSELESDIIVPFACQWVEGPGMLGAFQRLVQRRKPSLHARGRALEDRSYCNRRSAAWCLCWRWWEIERSLPPITSGEPERSHPRCHYQDSQC